MRGGALPAALLFAALAFALAFAPRRVLFAAVIAASLAAIACSLMPLPEIWREWVFAGCWASVAITAAMVHLPGGVGSPLSIVLAINAGIWAGATLVIAGLPLDLLRALPVLLLVLPAAWLAQGRGAIAIKVIASWLIAVAILAAALALVPTPGYAPDHMQ